MSDRLQHPVIRESVAYQLMLDLLHADGKGVHLKGIKDAATREEIANAYTEALRLVKAD